MTVRSRKAVLSGAVLVVTAIFSIGQKIDTAAPVAPEPQGMTITADRTDTKLLENGGIYKRYSGHVHALSRGRDTELSADAAEYESESEELRFFGTSSFRDSTRSLAADTVIYNERKSSLTASGDVVVREPSRAVTADQVSYLRNEKTLIMDGHVVIRDDSLDATITGERAVFNDSAGLAVITGEPSMVREQPPSGAMKISSQDTILVSRPDQRVDLWSGVTIARDSLVATSSYASYDRKNEIFTLTGVTITQDSMAATGSYASYDRKNEIFTLTGVTITQDSMTATGSYASYDRRNELFILTGSPVVHQVMHNTLDAIPLRAASVIGGDTIRVHLSDQQVSGVDIIGKAYGATVWRDSTGAQHSRSILESDDMWLSMAENRISLITAGGMARSYYFQNRQADTNLFVNEAAGDTLRFFFEQGRVAHLKISGSRGVGARGKYYEYVPEEPDTLAVSRKNDL